MKTKSPASGKRRGLDDDSQKIHSSTNSTKLNTTRNVRKVLNQLARKWASRGYYSTPNEALRVLLEGVNHG